MANPTGAVFVSYASQDADAAGRIAEGLRAADIEVWLDQSTLRAGDAWDAQIKKQIQDCTLFLPVISAHTRARSEGYFRREWKLATRRLLDLADDVTFLVPVVIDETREADARVPEEFLRAHWTRLPGGETPPAFAQRLRQLLAGDGAPEHATQSTSVVKAASRTQRAILARTHAPSRAWRVGFALTALLLMTGIGVFWYLQDRGSAPATQPLSVPASPVTASMLNERSIAVLPFANISGVADDEYFSDGLTEELLNRLANVQGLRVAARTSSFAFKNHAGSVKDVGQALGVRHILEGSVRRQDNRLRVTAQLVSTTDGFHLWSKTFERQVADVFAIQDEIARAVAETLRVQLVGRSDGAGEYGTTSNAAYDLYLRARHLYQSFQLDRVTKAIDYYERAIIDDPEFAAAYVGLADALSWQNDLAEQPHELEIRKRIQTLARKALELDPQSGDAHALLARELMYAWDFKAAELELRRAEAFNPNGEYVLANLAGYYMSFGWPPERAIEYARRGRDRDPLNPWAALHVPQAHWHAQQFEEALLELERVSEIDPNFWLAYLWKAMTLTELRRHAEASLAARRAYELNEDAATLGTLAITHARAGEADEARAAVAKLNALQVRASPGVHVALGDHEAALTALELEFRERDRWLPESLHYPELMPLHGQPRFQRIVRLLGQEKRVAQTANRALAARLD